MRQCSTPPQMLKSTIFDFFQIERPWRSHYSNEKYRKILLVFAFEVTFFSILEHCVTPFFPYFFLLTIMLTSTEEMLKKKSCPIYFSDTSPALEGKSMKVIKKMFYNLTFISESWFSFFNDLCKQRDLGINGNSGPYDVGLVFFFMSTYNW